MTELRLELPDAVLDELVERLTDLVIARLAAERRDESEFLTVAEAAELLRSKPQRVYDLLCDGRLTRHKDGSRVLISRAELVAHLLPTGPRSRMNGGMRR